MSNLIMISSKIDKKTYDILSELAESMKVSKTAILKEWINIMQKIYIQEQIKKSYSNLWNDLESRELVETGIQDFSSLYN